MERLQSAVVHNLIDIIVELFLRNEVVLAHRLADYLTDGHTGLERRKRILKDDLHFRAHLSHLGGGEVIDLFAVEENLTRCLCVIETEYRASGCSFSASGFSDETHRGSALQIERYAVNRFDISDGVGDHSALYREIFLKVIYLKDILRIVLNGGEIVCDDICFLSFFRLFDILCLLFAVCELLGFLADLAHFFLCALFLVLSCLPNRHIIHPPFSDFPHSSGSSSPYGWG